MKTASTDDLTLTKDQVIALGMRGHEAFASPGKLRTWTRRELLPLVREAESRAPKAPHPIALGYVHRDFIEPGGPPTR